jgi:ribosome modulation factor
MQHKILSNRYYLEGKLAFLENKHECPYQPGPEKGMWLAGQIEMREELRVLRESLSVQTRDSRDWRRVPSVAGNNSLQ